MSENIEVITSNRDSITRWRCYEKKCTAKIFTKTNYVLVKVEGSHAADHSAIDRCLIDRQIINSACKRKAVEDVSMRPKNIILRELMDSGQGFSKKNVGINFFWRKSEYNLWWKMAMVITD
eukprot:XP_016662940.1 PREDICTED: uncharacterized protein LOC107884717 [Acyrthosiphon pisum]